MLFLEATIELGAAVDPLFTCDGLMQCNPKGVSKNRCYGCLTMCDLISCPFHCDAFKVVVEYDKIKLCYVPVDFRAQSGWNSKEDEAKLLIF